MNLSPFPRSPAPRLQQVGQPCFRLLGYYLDTLETLWIIQTLSCRKWTCCKNLSELQNLCGLHFLTLRADMCGFDNAVLRFECNSAKLIWLSQSLEWLHWQYWYTDLSGLLIYLQPCQAGIDERCNDYTTNIVLHCIAMQCKTGFTHIFSYLETAAHRRLNVEYERWKTAFVPSTLKATISDHYSSLRNGR